VFPIALWEEAALTAFVSQAGGPVKILALSRSPSPVKLAELRATRISYGSVLHRYAMDLFSDSLSTLAAGAAVDV